jgi:hypothetical protein
MRCNWSVKMDCAHLWAVRVCPEQSNSDERVHAQAWSVIDEELAPLG